MAISLGSHASSDNLVIVEGQLEHAHLVPANERSSECREAFLFIRADETVVLTLIEDTVDEDSSISSTGFTATLGGVTADFSVFPEQDQPEADGWSNDQRAQALHLMARVPWGDVENSLYDLELCLERAIEATESVTAVWDEMVTPAGVADEFSLSSEEVAALESEQLIAYLGQLVRSARGAAGVMGDGSARDGSPAAVLQDLVLTDHDLLVE